MSEASARAQEGGGQAPSGPSGDTGWLGGRGPFVLLPAIDLRAGRCVRLLQGDPERQEVFASDPVEVARRFIAAGAEALHVVDLDGAFAGRPQQLPLLAAIAALGVPVQFGGGLRTVGAVADAFGAGATAVVVGTRALEEGFVRELLGRWGAGRVLAGLDARGDSVAVSGWRESAGISLRDAAAALRSWGAQTAVYTQVERDGMLGGPDLSGLERVAASGLRVVASGGVTTTGDIAELLARSRGGVCGAILGRALYTGRIALAHALRAAGRT